MWFFYFGLIVCIGCLILGIITIRRKPLGNQSVVADIFGITLRPSQKAFGWLMVIVSGAGLSLVTYLLIAVASHSPT